MGLCGSQCEERGLCDWQGKEGRSLCDWQGTKGGASSIFPVREAESAWRMLWILLNSRNTALLKQALSLTAKEMEDKRDDVTPGESQRSLRVLFMLPDDRRASASLFSSWASWFFP